MRLSTDLTQFDLGVTWEADRDRHRLGDKWRGKCCRGARTLKWESRGLSPLSFFTQTHAVHTHVVPTRKNLGYQLQHYYGYFHSNDHHPDTVILENVAPSRFTHVHMMHYYYNASKYGVHLRNFGLFTHVLKFVFQIRSSRNMGSIQLTLTPLLITVAPRLRILFVFESILSWFI